MVVPLLPIEKDLESKKVLRKVALAHSALAELKGVIKSIPNENILIETLALREARESAAIEQIISTYEEVYQTNLLNNNSTSPEAKEVHQYAEALKAGFSLVKANDLLTINYILQIQQVIEQNNAGLRKLPGTKLINDQTGETVYTPPQDYATILALMENLEKFINDDTLMDADPLVKMAIIHYQFETIHPFYDGNGRTGRIINILYLVQKKLLHLPVLHLSSYIITHKTDYYRLLQGVREAEEWEEWLLFMLDAVEKTAIASIGVIEKMNKLMQQYKKEISETHSKIYSHDLLTNLFRYPFTKIEYLQQDLKISRSTAIRYLEQLVNGGWLKKTKSGRDNFYLNAPLFKILCSKM
jgi:Fic family protein